MTLSVVVALCLALFAACGGGSSSTSASAGGNITFKLGHNSAETSVYHVGATKFAELLKEYSGGAITCDVYSAGALGSEEEMLDGMRTGTIDCAVINSANVARYYDGWNIFAIPYLFVDDDHLLKAASSDIGKTLADNTLKDAGIRVFTPFWADGFRMTMQRVREVKVPSDLRGIKIRVPDWPALIAVMKEFGAIPTAMPFGEVYMSVSAGIVDGLETSPWALVANKFYEIAKYVTLDGHLNTPTLLCMDPKKFDALDSDRQAVVTRAATGAGEYQYQFTRDTNDKDIQELKNRGCVVTEVDKSVWIAAAKPVFDKFAAAVDQNLLKRILDMAP